MAADTVAGSAPPAVHGPPATPAVRVVTRPATSASARHGPEEGHVTAVTSDVPTGRVASVHDLPASEVVSTAPATVAALPTWPTAVQARTVAQATASRNPTPGGKGLGPPRGAPVRRGHDGARRRAGGRGHRRADRPAPGDRRAVDVAERLDAGRHRHPLKPPTNGARDGREVVDPAAEEPPPVDDGFPAQADVASTRTSAAAAGCGGRSPVRPGLERRATRLPPRPDVRTRAPPVERPEPWRSCHGGPRRPVTSGPTAMTAAPRPCRLP